MFKTLIMLEALISTFQNLVGVVAVAVVVLIVPDIAFLVFLIRNLSGLVPLRE